MIFLDGPKRIQISNRFVPSKIGCSKLYPPSFPKSHGPWRHAMVRVAKKHPPPHLPPVDFFRMPSFCFWSSFQLIQLTSRPKKSIFCVQRSKFTDRSVWSIWLFQRFFDVQPKTWGWWSKCHSYFSNWVRNCQLDSNWTYEFNNIPELNHLASSNQWWFLLVFFCRFFLVQCKNPSYFHGFQKKSSVNLETRGAVIN